MTATTDTQPAALHCTSCGTDLHGDRWNWTCCRPCEDWMRDQLNTIEHLWQELPDHLAPAGRGPRASIGERHVRAPQAGRLPLSEAALDLLATGGAVDRLERHDAVLRIARGLSGTPHQGTADTRLAATVRSLRHHLLWAAEHVDLYDLAVELRALAGELAHATGQEKPERTHRQLTEPCPATGDAGEACGGPLLYDRAARTVQCDTCGHLLDPAHWIRLAARAA